MNSAASKHSQIAALGGADRSRSVDLTGTGVCARSASISAPATASRHRDSRRPRLGQRSHPRTSNGGGPLVDPGWRQGTIDGAEPQRHAPRQTGGGRRLPGRTHQRSAPAPPSTSLMTAATATTQRGQRRHNEFSRRRRQRRRTGGPGSDMVSLAPATPVHLEPRRRQDHIIGGRGAPITRQVQRRLCGREDFKNVLASAIARSSCATRRLGSGHQKTQAVSSTSTSSRCSCADTIGVPPATVSVVTQVATIWRARTKHAGDGAPDQVTVARDRRQATHIRHLARSGGAVRR